LALSLRSLRCLWAALALAFAASAADLPAAPDARARALVKTCEQITLSTGVAFRCPGAQVQLSSVQSDSEQSVLDEQIAAMRASFPGIKSVEPAEFKVAGKLRPGARFRVEKGAAVAPGMMGLVVVYAPDETIVRSVSCLMPWPEASMTARCEALLDGLGSVGPGFFAGSSTAQDPKFLDKKMTVPKGCKATVGTADGFEIVCDDKAALAYARQTSESQAKVALGFLRDYTLNNTHGARGKDQKCSIGGTAASCEVVRAPDLVIRIGVATIRGQTVVASCTQPLARKGVHPLCMQVMKF
jgi:hypothetical protein